MPFPFQKTCRICNAVFQWNYELNMDAPFITHPPSAAWGHYSCSSQGPYNSFYRT